MKSVAAIILLSLSSFSFNTEAAQDNQQCNEAVYNLMITEDNLLELKFNGTTTEEEYKLAYEVYNQEQSIKEMVCKA